MNAFELLGVDVMLDEEGHAWLLEINSSPSLSLATPLDESVKAAVIDDTVQLVNPLAFDRQALQRVLARRAQQRAGPVRLSRRQGGGLLSGTASEEASLLSADLHSVLRGARPRRPGEAPAHLGGFEPVAPCELLDHLSRLKRGRAP